MTSLGLRIRPGAVVLATAIACLTKPLCAQGAGADPAGPAVTIDSSDVAKTRASEGVPLAPFAAIHPTYVPSQPAPEDDAAESRSVAPPTTAAPHRAERRVQARAAAPRPRPALPPVVDLTAAVEPMPEAPQAVTAAIDRSAPATARSAPGLLHLAGGGLAALLLLALGFALGRRRWKSGRPIAKTPLWESVMPLEFAARDEPSLEIGSSGARNATKRVMRGRALDGSDQPASNRAPAPAGENWRGVCATPRPIVKLRGT